MDARKTVGVLMLATLYTDQGRLEKGKAYDVPEDRAAAWEKAKLCEKGGGKGEKEKK